MLGLVFSAVFLLSGEVVPPGDESVRGDGNPALGPRFVTVAFCSLESGLWDSPAGVVGAKNHNLVDAAAGIHRLLNDNHTLPVRALGVPRPGQGL